MDSIKQFHELLNDLVCLFDEMIALENKKLDAITLNSIDTLEQNMKDEQVFTLRLKGLELKREKIQAECGFEGLTLKAVIERSEGWDKEKFSEAYVLLENRTREFKDVVSSANKYIELLLLGLEHMLADPGRHGQEIGYDNKGCIKKDGKGRNEFKSKKV